MLTRTQLIFVLSLVAINNIAWIVYSNRPSQPENAIHPASSSLLSQQLAAQEQQPRLPTHAEAVTSIANSSTSKPDSSTPEDNKNNQHPIEENTPDLAEEQAQPLTAETQNLIYEQQLDAEYFFYNDKEKKLETLALLSPQGEDLKLLQEVIAKEEDKQIKVAAIRKLNQQNNYAATTTLLNALDDPSPEVALAAMETITANGDRTLLPTLKEKFAAQSSSSNPLHQEMKSLIQQLEYSVSMKIDGLNEQ